MIRLINVITSFISFGICLALSGNICDEYSLLAIVPIIYLVMSFILMECMHRKRDSNFRITTCVYVGIQWIRCVLTPAIGALSGFYSQAGSGIGSYDAIISVRLILYELILVSILVTIVYRFSSTDPNYGYESDDVSMTLSGNAKIYLIYVGIALLAMIITRDIPFQFFTLSSGTQTRYALQENNNLVLDTIIMYGFTFLVIVVVTLMYKKYTQTGRERYVNIALLMIMFRLALVSSESRLALIYQAGTGLLLLRQLFVKNKAKITRIIVIAAVGIVGLLTVYKVFYAFLYDSYIAAIASGGSNFSLSDLTSQLDAYFYGFRTVARNVTFIKANGVASFSTWLMDIIRNTFGVHYLVRGTAVTTIERYNLYIYGGRATSGYLFSSVAYGYMYYSAVFAPLATFFNYVLACWMEKRIRQVKFIDSYYILCLAYVRFAVSQFASFGGTWNYVSRSIVIGMLVVGIASIGRLNQAKSTQKMHYGSKQSKERMI